MLGDLRDEHGDLGEDNDYFKVDLTPKTRSSIWIYAISICMEDICLRLSIFGTCVYWKNIDNDRYELWQL